MRWLPSARVPHVVQALLCAGALLLLPPKPAAADYNPAYAISVWAGRYGLSADYLIAVARCESNLNPWARNPSGAYGLFQFYPATFAWGESRMNNDPTDTSFIDTRGITSVGAQAHVAAYLFAHGFAYLWACA